MTTRELPDRTASKSNARPGRTEFRAAVVGSLLGGVAGGILLRLAATAHLRLLGAVFGAGSLAGSFLVWLGLAVVLGVGFYYVVGQTLDAYVRSVMELTSKNPTLRNLLLPLVKWSALATTAGAIGLLYGVVTGAFVGFFAVPAFVNVLTEFGPTVPALNGAVLFAYTIYGLVMGACYGLTLERRVSVPSLGSRVGPAVAAGFVGALLGGVFLYAVRPLHLRYVGAVASSGTAERGLAAFIVVGVLFGLLGAFLLDIYLRQSPLLTGLGYGGLVGVGVGTLLVPILVNSWTPWALRIPLGNVSIISGYVIYGLAFAYTYRLIRGRGGDASPDDRAGDALAVGLVAAVLSGGLLFGTSPLYLRYVGSLLNSGTPQRGFLGWFLLALAFTLVFVRVAGRTTERTTLAGAARVGAIFGGLLAAVMSVVVPALVGAATPFPMALPYLDPFAVVGYVAFGVVLAVGYAARRGVDARSETPAVEPSRRRRATLFGGLLGGMVGGLVIHHLGAPVYLRFVGSLVGSGGSITRSWVAWLAVSVLLGAVFVRLLAPHIGDYVDSVIDAVSNNPDLEDLLLPTVRGAPQTTTAVGMGVVYGVGLAVVVGMVAFPLLVTALTDFSLPAPVTDPAVFFGFVVYGGMLGFGYGASTEF